MIIFSNGCYDLLHVGHFNLLQYCRHLAGVRGKVIVAIDSDNKIKKTKGQNRPLFSQEERRKNLLKLKYQIYGQLIDEVHIFDSAEELYDLIKSVNPDSLVIGDDWKNKPVIGEDLMKNKSFYDTIYGIHFFPKLQGISTTDIIKRCQKKS